MRSPKTIGEECPNPGSGVCQRTFLAVLMSHWSGSGLLVFTPEACGPRNCGQSSALAAGINAARSTAGKKFFGIGPHNLTRSPRFGNADSIHVGDDVRSL